MHSSVDHFLSVYFVIRDLGPCHIQFVWFALNVLVFDRKGVLEFLSRFNENRNIVSLLSECTLQSDTVV